MFEKLIYLKNPNQKICIIFTMNSEQADVLEKILVVSKDRCSNYLIRTVSKMKLV